MQCPMNQSSNSKSSETLQIKLNNPIIDLSKDNIQITFSIVFMLYRIGPQCDRPNNRLLVQHGMHLYFEVVSNGSRFQKQSAQPGVKTMTQWTRYIYSCALCALNVCPQTSQTTGAHLVYVSSITSKQMLA